MAKRKKIKQVFYHYTLWEDFKNGMYNEIKEGRKRRIKEAIQLLTNEKLLYQQMKRVTTEWKYATEQNLTNNGMNHQAFLGQTACNIFAGIKEDETREAWGYLTNQQRKQANNVADLVYYEWAREYTKNLPYYQMSIFDYIFELKEEE